VARPLGGDVAAAALGIHAVANAAMASAVRLMTVGRGIDSRGLPVVSSGGAAGAHVVAIAAELGLGEVLAPRSAGVLSALGLLCCDVAAEASHTRPMPLPADPAAVRELAAAAMREASEAAAVEGQSEPRVELSLDMRYRDQSHELPVPIEPALLDGDDAEILAAELARRFDAVYQAHYGVAPGGAVTLIGVRARAVLAGGGLPSIDPARAAAAAAAATPAPAATRTVVLAEHGAVEAAVHDWESLPSGACVAGPAVVEADDTSVLVPPGWAARVDARQTLHMAPEAGAAR
jgi:N-methylhydantoinase A/oxoprolinase/acetone carboxylase beta subunit